MGAYESMWGVKGDNGGKKRQENLPAHHHQPCGSVVSIFA